MIIKFLLYISNYHGFNLKIEREIILIYNLKSNLKFKQKRNSVDKTYAKEQDIEHWKK